MKKPDWYRKLKIKFQQYKRAKYIAEYKKGFMWASTQRAQGATLDELEDWHDMSGSLGRYDAFDDGVLSFIVTVRRIEAKPGKIVGVN
jgi:hypothetical protein